MSLAPRCRNGKAVRGLCGQLKAEETGHNMGVGYNCQWGPDLAKPRVHKIKRSRTFTRMSPLFKQIGRGRTGSSRFTFSSALLYCKAFSPSATIAASHGIFSKAFQSVRHVLVVLLAGPLVDTVLVGQTIVCSVSSYSIRK